MVLECRKFCARVPSPKGDSYIAMRNGMKFGFKKRHCKPKADQFEACGNRTDYCNVVQRGSLGAGKCIKQLTYILLKRPHRLKGWDVVCGFGLHVSISTTFIIPHPPNSLGASKYSFRQTKANVSQK